MNNLHNRNNRNNINNQLANSNQGWIWLLGAIWVATMYLPDPLPLVDEIGIPLILLKSKGGGKIFIVVLAVVVALTFMGFPPIGLF